MRDDAVGAAGIAVGSTECRVISLGDFVVIKASKTVFVASALALAAAAGVWVGAAFAAQPQMEGALRALRSAQGELQRVTQNKGGHAAAARDLVAHAIAEVQAGIEYGRAHGE